jgi:hypothetical protein
MLKELLERLRLVTFDEGVEIKTYAEKVQERNNLREELLKAEEERQAELDQIAEAMFELDYADADEADSFDGGPGNEGETQ